jgi:hypothetical protein
MHSCSQFQFILVTDRRISRGRDRGKGKRLTVRYIQVPILEASEKGINAWYVGGHLINPETHTLERAYLAHFQSLRYVPFFECLGGYCGIVWLLSAFDLCSSELRPSNNIANC